MSRIGKQPVKISSGVDVTITGNVITVKGTKGQLTFTFDERLTVKIEENEVIVTRSCDEKEDRSLHGLTRSCIQNMVTGVSEGFKKELEIIGVGYRATANGSKIDLSLGFSHPVEMIAPKGVTVEMHKDRKNTVVISGYDKQKVGQFAAEIRSLRKPEPYKGKGIRYVDEHVIRKAGKSAAK